MRSPSAPNWADTLVCPYGLVGMKGNGEIASSASGGLAMTRKITFIGRV